MSFSLHYLSNGYKQRVKFSTGNNLLVDGKREKVQVSYKNVVFYRLPSQKIV